MTIIIERNDNNNVPTPFSIAFMGRRRERKKEKLDLITRRRVKDKVMIIEK